MDILTNEERAELGLPLKTENPVIWPDAGWYVLSLHGSDGTPGIDRVEYYATPPESNATQTAYGPYEIREAAEAFREKLPA